MRQVLPERGIASLACLGCCASAVLQTLRHFRDSLNRQALCRTCPGWPRFGKEGVLLPRARDEESLFSEENPTTRHRLSLGGCRQAVVDCGALPALTTCLEEFDPQVKEGAAWALGERRLQTQSCETQKTNTQLRVLLSRERGRAATNLSACRFQRQVRGE